MRLIARTKKAAGFKTRGLDALETAALAKLKKGDEIVVTDVSDHVHIVGAIRAKKDCMGCHECKEGTLLGAFSYDLVDAAEWMRMNEDMFEVIPNSGGSQELRNVQVPAKPSN